MKVTLSYIPEEQKEAAAVLTALRPLLSWEKIHKTDTHPPFLHQDFSPKKPGKPRKNKKKA